MTAPNPTVFLVDVDDTLLDNDRIQEDLNRHLERQFGAECRDRYWAIQEELFNELFVGHVVFKILQNTGVSNGTQKDTHYRQ